MLLPIGWDCRCWGLLCCMSHSGEVPAGSSWWSISEVKGGNARHARHLFSPQKAASIKMVPKRPRPICRQRRNGLPKAYSSSRFSLGIQISISICRKVLWVVPFYQVLSLVTQKATFLSSEQTHDQILNICEGMDLQTFGATCNKKHVCFHWKQKALKCLKKRRLFFSKRLLEAIGNGVVTNYRLW